MLTTEKSLCSNEDPVQPEINKIFFLKKQQEGQYVWSEWDMSSEK